MRVLLRHKLLVAATTLVVAASAGGAYAATSSGTNSQQAFINDVAKRLNVSPAQLRAALKGAFQDRLQAAVKAGRLTQAQANRLEQRIDKGRLPRFLALPGPPGRGPFGPLRALVPAGPLHAAATYLGLTDLQLLSDLRSGKSLAQIAKARGKSVSGLEQTLTAAVKTQLNRLVTRGWITKAQEQRLLKRLSARIGRLVNRSRPGPRPIAGPALRALPGGPPGGPPVGPPPPGPGPMPPAA